MYSFCIYLAGCTVYPVVHPEGILIAKLLCLWSTFALHLLSRSSCSSLFGLGFGRISINFVGSGHFILGSDVLPVIMIVSPKGEATPTLGLRP